MIWIIPEELRRSELDSVPHDTMLIKIMCQGQNIFRRRNIRASTTRPMKSEPPASAGGLRTRASGSCGSGKVCLPLPLGEGWGEGLCVRFLTLRASRVASGIPRQQYPLGAMPCKPSPRPSPKREREANCTTTGAVESLSSRHSSLTIRHHGNDHISRSRNRETRAGISARPIFWPRTAIR
jgi:hypothetical protein